MRGVCGLLVSEWIEEREYENGRCEDMIGASLVQDEMRSLCWWVLR